MKFIFLTILISVSFISNSQTLANSTRSGDFDDPGVWDVPSNVNFGVNIQNGHTVNIPSGKTFMNAKINLIGTGKLNFATTTSKWIPAPDGSSVSNAASSASEIAKYYPNKTDGIYFINLPTVGVQQVYCLMDSEYDGGGWMLAMKATTGTTFNYDASYWTNVDTLNPNDISLSNGDAKYNVMNYFQAKDIMAIWPTLSNIGTLTGSTMSTLSTWSWLKNNFHLSGSRTTLISKFSGSQTTYVTNTSGDVSGIPEYNSTYFSRQRAFTFYGLNYTGNSGKRVRWGFAFNNETDQNSNDCSGGIGMNARSYSAGDEWSWNGDGQTIIGGNTSYRVQIFVR